ncbi:alpha/beta hydrolase [Meiothermus sp. QL-1]|uniref:alpha/beta fold hydrolase n=1 Tax=Meiothermus sp. QL-1 TaxID=2058095 RepID=UPI000E0BE8A4|nr:alpha/beta hydrolase [Meiothermus sp. QL-1]RDI96126.1 alpha/beta hydrolase [Meiothermus sp. QL-1]
MTPRFTPPEALRPYQRRVQVGGVGLHLYDTGPGQGPAFLLVHGLGDEADTWRKLFPLLRGRVIAPDLPGFGRSEHPRRAYTLGFFARVLLALLDHLGVGRAVLVGSSLGAAVVLEMALRRPERVERLCLVGGPPWGRPSRAQLLLLTPGLGERLYNRLRASQEAAYASLEPYYARFQALPPEDQRFLRERVWERVWSDDQRRAFFSTLRWMALRSLLGWRWQGLAPPVHLVWGAEDRVVPPGVGRRLAAAIPGARFSLIPDCGHLPQQEKPLELARLL